MNRNFWHKHGHTVIIYVFLAALMVFVSIFNKDFFTLGNFKNLLRSSFPLLMAALGQTLIILTGGIDLSLGGIVALCNVVCVMSMNPDSAWGFVPALGAAAAVGLACGAVNGVLVTKGRLAPIIVTIATTAVFDGMALLLMPNPGGSVHKAFAKFLTRGYSGAVPFLLFILILCLVRSLANSTPYGKALRAIGGSENAAYSTGIRVGKIKFCAYCLAGLLCAVAGIFLSAQMNERHHCHGGGRNCHDRRGGRPSGYHSRRVHHFHHQQYAEPVWRFFILPVHMPGPDTDCSPVAQRAA